ncbi:MAG: GntR family transcriptional regulator [Acidobacteria bacterium]|nr:GntR family transcriptional regulator [Acidobacteriota bacterium]
MPSPDNGSLVKLRLAAKLEQAIVERRLHPGERVVEAYWAREFGVAQASVREAINLLVADGFLVKNAGRSARVPVYTEADVARIYEVRGALEGLAAELAAASSSDLSAMQTALYEMESAAAAGDLRKLIDSDLAFHLALAAASRNPVLEEMLARLLRPLFTFVLARMVEMHESAERWSAVLPTHARIVDLIREGNPSLAGQYVRHCIGRFAESAHTVWSPGKRRPKPRG